MTSIDITDSFHIRKGTIEDIPLEAATVDVVISHCVVNLSADKPAVFAEMYRVLKPGGRLGIADVVAANDLAEAEKLERGSWVGCIAGAGPWAAIVEPTTTPCS